MAYGAGGVLLLFYAALLVGALSGHGSVVLLGALGSFVCDVVLRRTRYRPLLGLLGRVGLALSWRVFYRQVVVIVYLLPAPGFSRAAAAVVVIAIVVHHLAFAMFSMLRGSIARRRLRRVETRNLRIPAEDLPRELPRPLITRGISILLHCEVFFLAGLAGTVISGDSDWVVDGAFVMVVLALCLVMALVPHLRTLRRLPGHDVRWAAAQDAVLDLSPLVVLYFSGGNNSAYQVNMWLETMEQLGGRVLVIMRERRLLSQLKPTSLPVLCVPVAVDVMNLQIPSVRVGLYVANVGKNIHLLRVPTMMSAFIGHGDSDKTASFNPYSKVYDEVWVAGEAGRERYLRAQVGVRDDEIVLVGRPQLDAIQPVVPRPAGSLFTVLYAPTWEGWTDDLQLSSLIPMGRQIVELLLATPGVRVIYKPHPLTGSVQSEASRVSAEIAAMLAAAGPQHVTARGSEATLYDCFDLSDALISDISSVVSDYLKSGKPYFVTNNADLPADEFRAQNSAAGAGYLVGSGAAGLVEGLADARTDDQLRQRRLEVSTYVLGDPRVPAMDSFRRAVENLAARAEASLAIHRSIGGTDDDERMEAGLDGEGGVQGDGVGSEDSGGVLVGVAAEEGAAGEQ